MFEFLTCIIVTVILVSVKFEIGKKLDAVLGAIIFYTYCYLKV